MQEPQSVSQVDARVGIIRFDPDCKLYELVVNNEVVSKSKHPDYWEYHLRRGDLSKALVSLNITKYVHEASEASAEEKPAFTEHHFSNSYLAILGTGGQAEVKRKRGRPKKLIPQALGVKRNSLSDDEPVMAFKHFSKQDIIKMKCEHKRMVEDGLSSKESLDELTIKYGIPYKRAYDLVMS